MRLTGISILALLLACAIPAAATVVTLTFEGLQNYEPIASFYAGGTGGSGSGPGPNYGIYFSGNSLAIIDGDAGGSGNFGGEPSPDTIAFFTSGGAATMNVPAGFDTGFSFYYSTPYTTGFVNVWDGLDATGNLLASITLPETPESGDPDPTGVYSPLIPVGVGFSGIAKSVDFGGTADYIGFDNITLGASTPTGAPVPEPMSMVLAVLGLGAIVGKRRIK